MMVAYTGSSHAAARKRHNQLTSLEYPSQHILQDYCNANALQPRAAAHWAAQFPVSEEVT